MITFQLSCGHWQTQRATSQHAIGGPLPCTRCGSLRTVAIGWAAATWQGGEGGGT